jgi:hypothetical protein
MQWYAGSPQAGFRKIQDCVMEEEEFEGLEDLLVFS